MVLSSAGVCKSSGVFYWMILRHNRHLCIFCFCKENNNRLKYKSCILIKYELARKPKTDHIDMGSMFLNNNINKERPIG